MNAIDKKHVEKLKDIFPELTPDQLETAILFVLGTPKKEIAYQRSVTYKAVETMLNEIKVKFNVYSLSDLYSIFKIRLFFCVISLLNMYSKN